MYFDEMKSGEDDPAVDEREFDATTDTEPIEFLRRLPGITEANYRKVIDSVEDLHELSQMTQKQMQNLIGPLNGNKLYTFFNTVYNTVE
jgi:ERCC4-type nuclease